MRNSKKSVLLMSVTKGEHNIQAGHCAKKPGPPSAQIPPLLILDVTYWALCSSAESPSSNRAWGKTRRLRGVCTKSFRHCKVALEGHGFQIHTFRPITIGSGYQKWRMHALLHHQNGDQYNASTLHLFTKPVPKDWFFEASSKCS